MRDGHAVMVRLNDETYKDFEKWRRKLGQSKSGFATLCIAAGIHSVVRGVEPESALEPKLMADIIGMVMKSQKGTLRKLLAGKPKQ